MENRTLDNTLALLDAGKALGSPLPVITSRFGRQTKPCAILPADYNLQELPLADELPSQVGVNLDLDSVDSYIDYLNEYKSEETRLFALTGSGNILAIIDYHTRGTPADRGVRSCAHRVQLTPRRTKEWQAWVGTSGKKMDQDAFANHIEQWAANVWRPDAATMMEVATGLEATKSVRFKSAKRMADGQREFAYTEDVNGSVKGGTIPIPATFSLSLIRCYGEDPHNIEALLRYRIEEGNLVLWYDLHRLDQVEEEALGALCDKVKAATGIKALSTANLKTVII